MFNTGTIVEAGAAGVSSRYGSGSDQMMRLRDTGIYPVCTRPSVADPDSGSGPFLISDSQIRDYIIPDARHWYVYKTMQIYKKRYELILDVQ
jgi:hypothetical protein